MLYIIWEIFTELFFWYLLLESAMYYKTAVNMSNYVRIYPYIQDQCHCLHLSLTRTRQSHWNFTFHVLYTVSEKNKTKTGTVLSLVSSLVQTSTFCFKVKEGKGWRFAIKFQTTGLWEKQEKITYRNGNGIQEYWRVKERNM